LEEAVINAEAEQALEEAEADLEQSSSSSSNSNNNKPLTHVSTRDLLAARDALQVGIWTRIGRFFTGDNGSKRSGEDDKKEGLLVQDGIMLNSRSGANIQGASISASPKGTFKGGLGLNADPYDLLPSKCERLDELTADDFDWMGGEVIILPDVIRNYFGFKANERFGQFWFYFGLTLGFACLVLQVLSVSDPTDFAGA
jgi:hypothetical protein